MNGLIDMGQAEGAFVMGLGYILLEKSVYDPESGKCLNNGTWEYKPPMAGDIPLDFRVKLAENKTNVAGVLGAKAIGEPPLVLSSSIAYAIRHAIASARADRGSHGHFSFNLPATVDNVQTACLIDPKEFAFNK
jgi:xanthine dehydrogenase/oxidase